MTVSPSVPPGALEVLGPHGYVKLIEATGDGLAGIPEAGIIEAARMSTQGKFRGWDKDRRLLRYMFTHQHGTPFEFCDMTIEVCAPIFVFRQWHRHRTQCLHPDTKVIFERPSDGKAYPMRIKDVWAKWQPTRRSSRPERQVNALWPRQRISSMRLRCLDEAASEFTTTRVVDVIRGAPKPMVRVRTESGRKITATREHRFMTSDGWQTLGDAIREGTPLVVPGTKRSKPVRLAVGAATGPESWCPVVGWDGLYEVSDMGRVRRVGGRIKALSIGSNGYDLCSLCRPGEQKTYTVHRLVLEAFRGPAEGREARHLNSNRADNRLENLAWGTSAENSADMVKADRVQRLTPNLERIVSTEEVGLYPTYDLSVEGPWHNFAAGSGGGFVVHNSYNEHSARYGALPLRWYVPTIERVMSGAVPTDNRQASGNGVVLTRQAAHRYIERLDRTCAEWSINYQADLDAGIPKELARVGMPVGFFSTMRAKANLRNWLGFLKLRMDGHAQWEIRQYANAIGQLVANEFPETWELFSETL